MQDLTESTVARYCCFESYDQEPAADFTHNLKNASSHISAHEGTFRRLRDQGCTMDLSIALYFESPATFLVSNDVIQALAQSEVTCGFDLYGDKEAFDEQGEKSVPSKVRSKGPTGTMWIGGGVDWIGLALRVHRSPLSTNDNASFPDCEPGGERGDCLIQQESGEDDADFDDQVRELFAKASQMNPDWRTANSHLELELACLVRMERYNRGLEISSETMAALAQRHLSLSYFMTTSAAGESRIR